MRWLLMAAGLAMVVVGGLYTAGALGWVDSPREGDRFWATVGPIMAGLGVALVWVTARPPTR